MWSQNLMSERLGIEWPVLQAPMAEFTTPELVAAVSNAGGRTCANTGGRNQPLPAIIRLGVSQALRSIRLSVLPKLVEMVS